MNEVEQQFLAEVNAAHMVVAKELSEILNSDVVYEQDMTILILGGPMVPCAKFTIKNKEFKVSNKTSLNNGKRGCSHTVYINEANPFQHFLILDGFRVVDIVEVLDVLYKDILFPVLGNNGFDSHEFKVYLRMCIETFRKNRKFK